MKQIRKLMISCLTDLMVATLLPAQGISVKAVQLKNLALNKTATESSVYPDSGKTAMKAVDGKRKGDEDPDTNNDSRWSTKRLGTGTPSEQWDPNIEQWMMVDLGEEYTVNKIVIDWEGATATKYKLQGSLDGVNFTDFVESGTTAAGEMVHDSLDVNARYVKLLCLQPKTAKYGYFVYEFEVYSNDVIDDHVPSTAAEVIKDIQNTAPTLAPDGNSLVLPTVPAEYEIELYGTDNAQVVSTANVVYQCNACKGNVSCNE